MLSAVFIASVVSNPDVVASISENVWKSLVWQVDEPRETAVKQAVLKHDWTVASDGFSDSPNLNCHEFIAEYLRNFLRSRCSHPQLGNDVHQIGSLCS